MNIICHLCLILGVIVLADGSHPNWIPHRVLKHSLSLTILQAWFDDFPIHHQIIIKSFLVHLFEQGFGGDEWSIPIINLHTNTFFSPTVAQLNGSPHANAVTERKAIFKIYKERWPQTRQRQNNFKAKRKFGVVPSLSF